MTCTTKSGYRVIPWTLTVLGALNWGLMGIGGFAGGTANDWNVVRLLAGSWQWITWSIYICIGISGLVLLVHWCRGRCGTCTETNSHAPTQTPQKRPHAAFEPQTDEHQ